MRFYLMQHGEAKPEAEDPERSLTIRGEEETKKTSDAAKRLGIRPSRIYHSGIFNLEPFGVRSGRRQPLAFRAEKLRI